jgi:putative endonuclease
MVECGDHSLYTGYTTDLTRRVRTHNSGKGAKYTKSRLPVRLVYYETYEEKSLAMKREYQVKQLSRKEKLKLIQVFQDEKKDFSQKDCKAEAKES